MKATVPVLKLGSYSEEVRRLQFGLAALGYHPGPGDGHYTQWTERSIAVFQYSRQLYWDGVAGPLTLQKYNLALTQNSEGMGRPEVLGFRIKVALDHEDPPNPLAPVDKVLKPHQDPKLVFKAHQMDPGPDGYSFDTTMRVREDVSDDLSSFQQAVSELGGVITLDKGGGKRPLSSTGSIYSQAMCFRFLGRAFHLHPYSGMQDPHSDPYILTREGEAKTWTVWCRSRKFLPHLDLRAWVLEAPHNRRHKGYTQIYPVEVRGGFFNFTELAGRFGFRPIPMSPLFPHGYSYHGANWWHFQWERGLDFGTTRFGEELRKGYRMSRIESFEDWGRVKNLRFGLEWR